MTPRTNKPIPDKLKQDAIIEALFEIRFDTATIPEILFGRLADYEHWKGFKQVRLPGYEIPDPVRQVDQNLRYTPVFELRDSERHRAVRLGPHVLSYHQVAPYVGWAAFRPELLKAIDGFFAKAGGVTVKRLGFRYINALRSDLHRIGSVLDLDLRISVDDQNLPGKLNLNFTTGISDNTQCTVRVATPDFIQGSLPSNTSVVIDVDVSTTEPFRADDSETVKNWLDFAHVSEKENFFSLLKRDTISLLRES